MRLTPSNISAILLTVLEHSALALAVAVGFGAGSAKAATTTSVYDLGTSPAGTAIAGSGASSLFVWIAKGSLPAGSILRSVTATNLKVEVNPSDSYAADVGVFIDPTPEVRGGPGGLLSIGEDNNYGGAATETTWNGQGLDDGPFTVTLTAGTHFPGTIDLGTAAVMIGSGYGDATWSGTITVEYDLPEPASIVAFDLSGSPAVIDQDAKTIAWTVPNGTDVTALAPSYTLTSGTCDKDNGGPTTYDFTTPVTYTVTDTVPDPDAVNVYTVTVTVAPPGPPVTDYARWFDASEISGKVDGDPVTTWNDGSVNAAHATVPAGNANPTFVANAGTETGLPAVYFPKNGGAGNSGALLFTRDSGIRTVFSVFKGNSFLLTDLNAYHFHRPGDDNPSEPLWVGWTSDRIKSGTTYVNGVAVNGESFSMPTDLHNGFNLVEVLTTDPVQADGFNKDRVYHAGNQYQAEVIIYDRVLTEQERVSVERYLMHKWFNVFYGLAITIDSPSSGQGFPTNSSVTATATVYNGTPPFSVQFYRKVGAGAFETVGAAHVGDGPTFAQDLGTLPNDNYAVYATVSDGTTPTPQTATCAPGNNFLVSSPFATTTTLDTPAGPTTYGESVTFTATVSGPPPGGTVQFYDNGVALGTPRPVNPGTGQASYSTTMLAVGTHPITAAYGGHDAYLTSTSPAVSQVVGKAVLTVTADNKIRIPGAANPVFTYKITGYQNGEDFDSSGMTGAPALSTLADPGSPDGPYEITCAVGDLAAANYGFETVNGTLTVKTGALPVSAGLVCWYAASEGVTEDAGGVLTWNDLSGNGHHATRGNGTITLVPGDLNSLPAVHLRGGNTYLNCDPVAGMFTKEQYVVVRSPGATWNSSGSFLGRASNDFLSVRVGSYNLAANTTGFWQDHFPIAVSKNGKVIALDQLPNNGPGYWAIAPITDYMILKITVDQPSPQNIIDYPNYQIGKNETLGTMDFDVAEIIGYQSALTPEEENLVGAYLSNKYKLSTEYVPSGNDYATWAAGYPGYDLADPAADLDGDGLSNNTERAFGLDPTNGSSLHPISVPLDPAAGTFSYTRRDPALSGLTYTVWTSTDLQTWTQDPGAGQVPGAVLDEVQTVMVTLTASPVDGKLFVRVLATGQPAGTTYDTWIGSKGLAGPDALPGADPDRDGLGNALEMLLGGEPNPANPGWNSAGLLPTGAENAGGDLVFTFTRKDLSEGAATLTFQWSTDLSFPGANDVPVGAGSSITNGVTVDITEDSPDADTDTIVVTVPAAKAAGGGMLYGRLSATIP